MESLNMSNLVSDLTTTTCEINRRPNMAKLQASELRLMNKSDIFFSVRGSTAEFYITPALPYVGDFDIMMRGNEVIALPVQGIKMTYFQHCNHKSRYFVICEDNYKCKGIINLRFANKKGKLANCTPDSNFLPNNFCEDKRKHGPALTLLIPKEFQEGFRWYFKSDVDFVLCTNCPVWPPEANSWTTRLRPSGWPNASTVAMVVDSGCDFVPATHHDHRPNSEQWRYSFSRGEIILLQSWTSGKQLVYHRDNNWCITCCVLF